MSGTPPSTESFPGGRATAQDDRHETPHERLDRNLTEMMGELRVVITGVQALFAFLLVVPFDNGFTSAKGFERGAYYVALACAALSALCLIAPTAQHRVLFRDDEKRHLVGFANGAILVGLGFLALAMSGALLFVSAHLFGTGVAIIAGALALGAFVSVWLVLPIVYRARRHGRGFGATGDGAHLRG